MTPPPFCATALLNFNKAILNPSLDSYVQIINTQSKILLGIDRLVNSEIEIIFSTSKNRYLNSVSTQSTA